MVPARSAQFDTAIAANRFGGASSTLPPETAGFRSSGQMRRVTRWRCIILLDQFSRNIFRDDPRALHMRSALDVAKEAIALDRLTPRATRVLLYAFMHSGSRQTLCRAFTTPRERAFFHICKGSCIVGNARTFPTGSVCVGRLNTRRDRISAGGFRRKV